MTDGPSGNEATTAANADVLATLDAASSRHGVPARERPTARGTLRVFAAGSLRPAFGLLAAAAPGTLRLEYANARDLAERIAAGETADVFASASPQHPQQLHDAGLAGTPVPFASNRLVVAVPAASRARDVGVLVAPRARVVVEVEGIPLGDYTREALRRLDALTGEPFAARTMANVVDEVQTVDVVAARLLDGRADAAILYATDVAARPGQLRAIDLPGDAAVGVTCVVCTVTASRRPRLARAWTQALCAAPARMLLERSGFAPPPAAVAPS